MAFVEANSVVLKLSDYPDKPITGYYLEFRMFENEVGESKIHKIQLKSGPHKGEHISFYGFGILNNIIENQVSVGELVEITYTGKITIPTKWNKGGTICHNAKVRVDHDDILAGIFVPEPVDPTLGYASETPAAEQQLSPPVEEVEPPF